MKVGLNIKRNSLFTRGFARAAGDTGVPGVVGVVGVFGVPGGVDIEERGVDMAGSCSKRLE